MSDTDFCGDLYSFLEKSELIRKRFVNKNLQLNISNNVENTSHTTLDTLISNYGVNYGEYVVLSFCDSLHNAPPLDFAAFLPISRHNAAKNADEYKRLVAERLKSRYFDGFVITMAIEPKTHEIEYYSEISADDYFCCLFNWSTKCCAEFLLNDDKYPFHSVITPSLRQIAVYAFGRESDGVVSAEDSVVGDVCVSLTDCILRNKPIDCEIANALQSQLQKKDCFLQNYGRLCSVFEAVKRYNGSFGVYI